MTQRFSAAIGSTEQWIALEPTEEPGRFRLTRGDRTELIDARRLEHGVWSVLIGDRAYEIDLDGAGPDFKLQVRGEPLAVTLLDERAHRLKEAAAKVGARAGKPAQASVVCPMPGRVVKLLAKVGDTVKAGQGLIVVEAMKMENEMRATRDGVVKSLAVKEGQAVEAGQTLAVVE